MQSGDVAESFTISKLAMQDKVSAIPNSENEPYDIIVDDGSSLRKVQIKKGRVDGDKIKATLKRSNLNSEGRKQKYYSSEEIDGFMIAVLEIEEVLWLPIEEAPKSHVTFRTDSENSDERIKWLENYTI
jgi:hypothetical protein